MKTGYWVIESAILGAGLSLEEYAQAWSASYAVAFTVKAQLERKDKSDYSVVSAHTGEVLA